MLAREFFASYYRRFPVVNEPAPICVRPICSSGSAARISRWATPSSARMILAPRAIGTALWKAIKPEKVPELCLFVYWRKLTTKISHQR